MQCVRLRDVLSFNADSRRSICKRRLPIAVFALFLAACMPGAAQSDTTPPSVPTGLVGKAVSSTQINLSWNPSSDDVAVAGYFIYLNDAAQPLAQTTGTSFQHSGLAAGTTYNYRVSSFDAASNTSAWTGPRLSVI